MGQDLPQPGQQLLRPLAAERQESLLAFEQGVLDEVGLPGLGPEVPGPAVGGDRQEGRAEPFEQPTEGVRATGPGIETCRATATAP